MEETIKVKTRPLEVVTDTKSRLQIPAIVRKMIRTGPGDKFNLFVTADGNLYFTKADK